MLASMSTTVIISILGLFFVPLASPSSTSPLLKNVTDAVFGQQTNILPLAFGDFNSDTLTDLIVLSSDDRSKISVLLAEMGQTFSISQGKYFDQVTDARAKKLLCYANGYDILSAAPGDFDGDGGMDIMVVTRRVDSGGNIGESLMIHILWGNHNQDPDKHELTCPPDWDKGIIMDSEPLVLDGNGDDITDLYGSANRTRGIWTFGADRVSPPSFSVLDRGVSENFRMPHSNAFVDLNGDGNADIFITNESGFELWENVGPENVDHFKKHKTIRYPSFACTDSGSCIGQSVFADFDLDGHIDMIFPACETDECETSSIYFATMKNLWKGEEDNFLAIPLNLGPWHFDRAVQKEDHNNPYRGLSPHVGDINLDGYPDILIRLKNKFTKKSQMHLLLNVEDSSSPLKNQRGFLLQTDLMAGINETVIGTFYDLYENGMEDVMVVRRKDVGQYEIGMYVNATQDSDAYFVKVIVLTGRCYKDCSGNHIGVPYGTNFPGQTICYQTERPQIEASSSVMSCAPQLAQTAHHALQLPYTIFGLGLSPNFLDYISVNVTNATSISRGKLWPQIIPNSQVYVIPHPSDEVALWQAKLFITPSRGITLTGLALIGTCVICVVIILFFQWRERKEDLREKLQQPNAFHFDAM